MVHLKKRLLEDDHLSHVVKEGACLWLVRRVPGGVVHETDDARVGVHVVQARRVAARRHDPAVVAVRKRAPERVSDLRLFVTEANTQTSAQHTLSISHSRDLLSLTPL